MEEMRLRASRRVCIRGESGKFPRIWISLSVKSIESCGYMKKDLVSIYGDPNKPRKRGKCLWMG